MVWMPMSSGYFCTFRILCDPLTCQWLKTILLGSMLQIIMVLKFSKSLALSQIWIKGVQGFLLSPCSFQLRRLDVLKHYWHASLHLIYRPTDVECHAHSRLTIRLLYFLGIGGYSWLSLKHTIWKLTSSPQPNNTRAHYIHTQKFSLKQCQ